MMFCQVPKWFTWAGIGMSSQWRLWVGQQRNWDSILSGSEIFLSFETSKPVLWHTQPLTQWLPGLNGLKENEADDSHLSSVEVKTVLCCTFIGKVHPCRALRLYTGRTAHRGSRGIALLFHDHGTRRGEGSASHPVRYLPPGKDPVPIVQEAGWAPGPVWTGVENLAPPPPGLRNRTVQPVATR
jgi:hypothetical protein